LGAADHCLLVAGSSSPSLCHIPAIESDRPGTMAGAAAVDPSDLCLLGDLESVIDLDAVGFLSYGMSLVLFILALRHLGTARAGAYFSVAPFFGAVVAVLAGQDSMTWPLAVAATLMGLGVWLNVLGLCAGSRAERAPADT
jgi:drug/metabolite transporter (DMT)-like permease